MCVCLHVHMSPIRQKSELEEKTVCVGWDWLSCAWCSLENNKPASGEGDLEGLRAPLPSPSCFLSPLFPPYLTLLQGGQRAHRSPSFCSINFILPLITQSKCGVQRWLFANSLVPTLTQSWHSALCPSPYCAFSKCTKLSDSLTTASGPTVPCNHWSTTLFPLDSIAI